MLSGWTRRVFIDSLVVCFGIMAFGGIISIMADFILFIELVSLYIGQLQFIIPCDVWPGWREMGF